MAHRNPRLHHERWAVVKDYVSFDLDPDNLTAYQKRKLHRYAHEVENLTRRSGGVKAFKPRGRLSKGQRKHRLLRMQQLAQHPDTTLSELTVAFVPTSDKTARLKYNQRRDRYTLIQYDGAVETVTLYFDPERLARGPRQHTFHLINLVPDAEEFRILAGEYLTKQGAIPRAQIPAAVERMVNNYQPGGAFYQVYSTGTTNHWRHWLTGLRADTTRDQGSLDELRELEIAMQEAAAALEPERTTKRQHRQGTTAKTKRLAPGAKKKRRAKKTGAKR